MILKLRTDDGRHLADWRISADAPDQITAEFLQPVIDIINRNLLIKKLKLSGVSNDQLQALLLEVGTDEEGE
jgi:hypothetical protein